MCKGANEKPGTCSPDFGIYSIQIGKDIHQATGTRRFWLAGIDDTKQLVEEH